MFTKAAAGTVLFLLLLGLPGTGGAAEEGLVSTMSLVAAVSEVEGIHIVPATDVPSKVYTEDYSPSQVLEIIRPNMEAVSVGRLNSSCTCVQVSLPKRDFAQGERALLEVRNVKATPAAGATYAVFVQLNKPVRGVIQYDIFVKSTAEPGKAPSPAAVSEPASPQTVPAAPQTGAAPAKPAEGMKSARAGSSTIICPAGTPAAVLRTSAGPWRYEDITPYRRRAPETKPATAESKEAPKATETPAPE